MASSELLVSLLYAGGAAAGGAFVFSRANQIDAKAKQDRRRRAATFRAGNRRQQSKTVVEEPFKGGAGLKGLKTADPTLWKAIIERTAKKQSKEEADDVGVSAELAELFHKARSTYKQRLDQEDIASLRARRKMIDELKQAPRMESGTQKRKRERKIVVLERKYKEFLNENGEVSERFMDMLGDITETINGRTATWKKHKEEHPSWYSLFREMLAKGLTLEEASEVVKETAGNEATGTGRKKVPTSKQRAGWVVKNWDLKEEKQAWGPMMQDGLLRQLQNRAQDREAKESKMEKMEGATGR